MKRNFITVTLLIFICIISYSQTNDFKKSGYNQFSNNTVQKAGIYSNEKLQVVTPDFSIPDTVCVGTPVNIVNTSTNATTSFWNFCVANINSTPDAVNLGNIGGQFLLPVFIDYVQYNGNYYGFVTNNTPGKLTRLDFGNSLLNTPTAVNLGDVGGIVPMGSEGIQVVFNEGKWYALIVGGNNLTGGARIVKIEFGADLTNTSPVGTNWGNVGNMNYPIDLHLFNDNGNWYAFTVDQGSSVFRFSFGTSFNNPPSVVNFGNVNGTVSQGTGIYAINDAGSWYVFVANRGSSTITRLDFGNSLLNTPVGVNLGSLNGTVNLPRDIYLMNFCDELFGFIVNEGTNDLVKLNFSSLNSIPSAFSLGSVGNLSFPHSISKLFRIGSDLYSFIPNVNNNTLTRIRFTGCSDANIPNYAGTTPPPIIYSKPGTYNINLTIDDGLPSQGSICKKIVVVDGPDIDFTYSFNPCNSKLVQFNAFGLNLKGVTWDFGDGNIVTGNTTVSHTYNINKPYTVTLTANFNGCSKTITKTIDISLVKDNIILSNDTILCAGASQKLLTIPAVNFCWNPVTYLDDPNSPAPVAKPQKDITYHYTAQVIGQNLVVNGDFSQGNTGFSSDYVFANSNVTEGQYFVGANPGAWNPLFSNCTDHTGGGSSMLLANGSPVDNMKVWRQTINVTPNTNYAFSAWLQAVYPVNPAQLEFSINDKTTGTLLNASTTTCTWNKFFTTWNSGNTTSATITIVNRNTLVQGNDFALDDISFTPIFLKTDSVVIKLDTVLVKAASDKEICEGISTQLNATGAVSYNWFPSGSLNNSSIANPTATPSATTQYIVTGTDASGCTAKDTLVVVVNPKPIITITPDSAICNNASLQLNATGGITYTWTPAGTLSNAAIANPIASPAGNTTYHVIVTDSKLCSNVDSVLVTVRPSPVFSISGSEIICAQEKIQLNAGGGDLYLWSPIASLDKDNIANPLASPIQTTTYSVIIKDIVCNNADTLSTTISVLSLPNVKAFKSNDLDCSVGKSNLNATGASVYTWTPATGLDNPSIPNPVATPVVQTLYTVKGTDINGCSNEDTVTVKILGSNTGNYYMPNIFTPNNDGINDCYGIKYWGVLKQVDFSIYNRWGQLVFHTNTPYECWDGFYKGRSQDIGEYVYVIKAETLCGSVSRKGLFSLIR